MTQRPGDQEVAIHVDRVVLEGTLTLPPRDQPAAGLVIFAHGSGSSRLSTRNRFVAGVLNDANLATLLFDLLSEAEARMDELDARHRFDIPLLARRLTGVVDWARDQTTLSTLPLGLFGASTGAAAALVTAAERPQEIGAVVSRGGRPDLAADVLRLVKAPTLLIVGGRDEHVIELNQRAAAQMAPPPKIEIVPHATHLFEEPGTLSQVAELAQHWFRKHLN